MLVTLVDRRSRYTLIAKAENKTATAVSQALLRALVPHRQKVKTLTYDNGKEFARHEMIEKILDATGYFANPYSSWERGLNEPERSGAEIESPHGGPKAERSELKIPMA